MVFVVIFTGKCYKKNKFTREVFMGGNTMEFPKDFFKTERRCDFEVPAMMKRAWAAQMEVLEVVADICDRNHLQYYADWGTLLGAIRHKGFIPWDDDIDICMKRKDYNKLIRILPRELPYGFVVAGMYADSERLQNAAFVPQLRVIADETLWDFNDYMHRFHGFPYQRVGIDIFPLDKMPADEEMAMLQRELVRQGIVIIRDWDKLEKTGELKGCLEYYGGLCNVEIPKRPDIKNWMWKFTDTLCSIYEEEKTEEITNWGVWMTLPNLYRLKSEWYDNVCYVPFENIQIPVPSCYNEVLEAQFGDYMTPLQVGGGHDYPFYGEMEAELEKQIRAVGFNGSIDEFCEKVASGQLWV